MSSHMLAYIITNESIQIFIDDKNYIIETTNAKYEEIIVSLRETEDKNDAFIETLMQAIDMAYAINAKDTSPLFKIEDGIVYYKGEPLKNHLTERLVYLFENNMPYTFLYNFMENCELNEHKYILDEIYDFLEKSQLPITEDGCFLAYKKVNSDYMDFYSGTKDYSVGNIVTEDVCDFDRQNHCSKGLHFCAKSYLDHYYGHTGIVVCVKVNPKNVVAVPRDYGYAKGRCKELEVLYTIQDDSDTNGREERKDEFDGLAITDKQLNSKVWTNDQIKALKKIHGAYASKQYNFTWKEFAKKFVEKTSVVRSADSIRHAVNRYISNRATASVN